MTRTWVLGLVTAAIVTGAGGCTTGVGSRERSERLLVLAQEETRNITVPKDRLRRLLNIAEIQIRFERPADARLSLADAGATLRSDQGRDIDQFTQLAGWISISELSRRTGDKASANKATDEALALLRRVQPEQERAQYVHAIAAEVKELRGEAEGAKVLSEGALWAAKIMDVNARRQAFTSFADQAFWWEQYDAGRDVLRQDTDPAWRVDTLTRMADAARIKSETWAAKTAADALAPPAQYGKSLSYEKNFQQQLPQQHK